MSKSNTDKAEEIAADNGILNPSGAIIAAFAPLYLVAVPITSYITKPDGVIQKLIEAAIRLIPGGTISSDRIIPALSALYVFWTFGGSGAVSAAGQAMSRPEGIDNEHPRKHLHTMDGFPLRLRSAHYGLMENFPGFAIAAALAQILAPRDQQISNLLGLHVLGKLFVFYPAYLANIAPPRTLSHVLANGAVINVLWRLAIGAK